MDLMLGINKSLAKINSGDSDLESCVLPKTALLILQFLVSSCHAKVSSLLLLETEVLLGEFFETNGQCFHIFFIHQLTWRNKFLAIEFSTVE
jgi:hypothetical protein